MPKSKPRIGALHRYLRLQHHSHTGRRLHHKHTSYRGLALIVAVAGAFMLGLNILAARVNADSSGEIHVYAKVSAAFLTEPAAITSPLDGTIVSKSSLPVSGTCPVATPKPIVAILDNGVVAGSVSCDSDDTFSLGIILTPGQHTLIARAYNMTGDPAPDSDPVHVTYFTPAPVTSNTGAAAGGEKLGLDPLTVTIDEPFIVFGPGKDAVWTGTITGGALPYHVHIDWGDGSSSDYTITKSGHQAFAHHYRAMEPHIITLRVTDADGRSVTKQYAAVTPYRSPIPIFATSKPHMPYQGSVTLGLYGAYLLLLATIGALWIHNHRGQGFRYAHQPATRSITPKHRVTLPRVAPPIAAKYRRKKASKK
jgi:hypothetical protein